MEKIVKNEKQILQCINGATSLQEALQRVYTNGSRFKLIANEETLFGAVLCYFKGMPQCTIWSTHKKDKVRAVNAHRSCEISDLLIIAYSPKRKEFKINFLQAKKAPFDNPKLGLIYSNKTPFLKFHINGTQYRLLKDLPVINPQSTIFPSNILSDACTDSITSYGVFYLNGGNADMGYEITQLLQPTNPSNVIVGSKNKTCCFGTTLNTYGISHRGCCHYIRRRRLCLLCCSRNLDLHSTLSANIFENALLNFRIGSPLCGWQKLEFIECLQYYFAHDDVITDDFKYFCSKNRRSWYIEAHEFEYEDEIRPAHVPNRDKPQDDFQSDGEMYMPNHIMLINVDGIYEEERHRY